MSANPDKPRKSPAGAKPLESKLSMFFSPFFICAFLFVCLVIGFEVFRNSQDSTPTAGTPANLRTAPRADADELKPVVKGAAEKPLEWSGVANRQADREVHRPAQVVTSSTQTPAPVSPEAAAAFQAAKQIIAGLTQVDLSPGELTAEQAQQIDQSVKQLVQQGAGAVPAIREFLERNLDLGFDDVKGGKAVGYGSVRIGLLDALQQIGGPEATQLSLQILQTTADPREVAWLAQSLEQQSPGQYRQEALNAIRETLQQAAKGTLGKRDVGPLFQALQTLGDATVISDIQKDLPTWSYYTTMTLAGLPDGAGVSGLIGITKDPSIMGSASGNFALQMLAQIAPLYPDAAEALLEQARANQISERAWRQIATGLAGDQYQFVKHLTDGSLPVQNLSGLKGFHIESGNQNFYSTPVGVTWPAEQIEQRRQLIDRLLAVNTSPVAARALTEARASLVSAAPQN